MSSRQNHSLFVAVGAMATAIVAAPIAAYAAPPICPQFVTKDRVYNSHRVIFTAETNRCFAKERLSMTHPLLSGVGASTKA